MRPAYHPCFAVRPSAFWPAFRSPPDRSHLVKLTNSYLPCVFCPVASSFYPTGTCFADTASCCATLLTIQRQAFPGCGLLAMITISLHAMLWCAAWRLPLAMCDLPLNCDPFKPIPAALSKLTSSHLSSQPCCTSLFWCCRSACFWHHSCCAALPRQSPDNRCTCHPCLSYCLCPGKHAKQQLVQRQRCFSCVSPSHLA